MKKEHLSPQEQEADTICLEEETVVEVEPDTDESPQAEPNINAEVLELEGRLQRLQADFSNFRKRVSKERLEQAQMIEAALVAQLLPVIDNFERALANLSSEADVSWTEGVQLVYKQLLDVLAQQGLERVNTEKIFDPNIHEAVLRETCTEEQAEGTILQELQPGYLYQGRLLRPSMVKVATR